MGQRNKEEDNFGERARSNVENEINQGHAVFKYAEEEISGEGQGVI